MNYERYSGTAAQYIREYLDPDGELLREVVDEDTARALWHQLEDVFADDGGTGISEEDFVTAATLATKGD